jgi:hypothetical protein
VYAAIDEDFLTHKKITHVLNVKDGMLQKPTIPVEHLWVFFLDLIALFIFLFCYLPIFVDYFYAIFFF